MVPQLETERLILREFDYKDVEDLYEYCKDEEVTKFVGVDTYENIETAQDRIDFLKAQYAQESKLCWAIEERKNKKVIGSVDLFNICYEKNMGEIGYMLNKSYWNKGYMTEAVNRVLKFGFEDIGLREIIGKCIVSNISSQRVLEKVGMKDDGILEEIDLNGIFYKQKQYSINFK